MVDRIKLVVFDKIPNVGMLNHRDTVFLEQFRNPRNKAIGIGDMGENVVGVYDIGGLPLGT